MASSWSQSALTGANGEFAFHAVPIGEYTVHVASAGFAPLVQEVVEVSGSTPILHLQLRVANREETATVSVAVAAAPPTS